MREKEVQVKFSEFPHDMRVLIDQITEDAGAEYAEDDAEIPAGMVLTESFPAKIEGNEPGDDGKHDVERAGEPADLVQHENPPPKRPSHRSSAIYYGTETVYAESRPITGVGPPHLWITFGRLLAGARVGCD